MMAQHLTSMFEQLGNFTKNNLTQNSKLKENKSSANHVGASVGKEQASPHKHVPPVPLKKPYKLRNVCSKAESYDTLYSNALSMLLGLLHKSQNDLPLYRRPSQAYVYANFEAAVKCPKLGVFWNNYFNLTWTYKLDSDIHWRHLVIKNASHHVVGPRREMDWMKLKNMDSVDEEVAVRLKYKKKVAAWFPTNCYTLSQREYLVLKIHNALKNYGLKVDIFGKCGSMKCPNGSYSKCLELLEKDYYFYLSFEKVLNEDYVTEILLPLRHNLVPVVYGRANYSRFLPEEVYLDAFKLSPEEIASKMIAIMLFPQVKYYDMFKWKKHYSYHNPDESSDSDNYCQFCAQLNKKENAPKLTKNLLSWWKT